MKKKYTPPAIYVENLTLSHHIAACSGTVVKLNSNSARECGAQVVDSPNSWLPGGMKIFASDGFCAKDLNDEYVHIEQYCYTNQDSSFGLFFGS